MPAVAPQDRITQSDHELHVGLEVPRHSAKQIHNWVLAQQWPPGSQLEHPKDYHVTLLYTPEGHNEHKDAWWMSHLGQTPVSLSGFESFPPAPDGQHPYVLRINSPEIEQHATMLQHRAEAMGLPITHFPGGYTPHLTVGYGPQAVTGLKPPNFEFDIGPSSVSPVRPNKEANFRISWQDYDPEYSDPITPEHIAMTLTSDDIPTIVSRLKAVGWTPTELIIQATLETYYELRSDVENLGYPPGDLSYSSAVTRLLTDQDPRFAQARCLNCESPLDEDGRCSNCSTVPTQVNDPEDHWPEHGERPPDRKHDVQFSNDWGWKGVT